MNKLTKEIKEFRWENRVYRTGFLQSKDICNEAEIIPIKLTKNYFVKYQNIFWIQDYNLYDENATKSFVKVFNKAFKENKSWPLSLFYELERTGKKVNNFITKLKKNKNKTSLILFREYVELLHAVQKYYVIAVPLVSYCEKALKIYPKVLENYSKPYKELEVSKFNYSKNTKLKFAWLKTAYNIIDEVSDKDVLQMNTKKDYKEKILLIPKRIKYLVVALQVGIYLRNRIKELSQKLWYYIEPVAKQLAKEMKISRDDFFLLTHQEVEQCLKGNGYINSPEFARRRKSFVVGFWKGKKQLISGTEASSLVNVFRNKSKSGDYVKGTVAYKGKVKGIVKIILDKKDFKKIKKGNILVTSMTTPNFIVLMKKVAAIVTDEGGLSCHAAIVSRELKIPCIIGTKDATKILSNRDYVEVDAIDGIVRVLKRG